MRISADDSTYRVESIKWNTSRGNILTLTNRTDRVEDLGKQFSVIEVKVDRASLQMIADWINPPKPKRQNRKQG